MRVFEDSTKVLDNQVIDQILKSSNTQINLIYSVISVQREKPNLVAVVKGQAKTTLLDIFNHIVHKVHIDCFKNYVDYVLYVVIF